MRSRSTGPTLGPSYLVVSENWYPDWQAPRWMASRRRCSGPTKPPERRASARRKGGQPSLQFAGLSSGEAGDPDALAVCALGLIVVPLFRRPEGRSA